MMMAMEVVVLCKCGVVLSAPLRLVRPSQGASDRKAHFLVKRPGVRQRRANDDGNDDDDDGCVCPYINMTHKCRAEACARAARGWSVCLCVR